MNLELSDFVGSGNESQIDGDGLFCSFKYIAAMTVSVEGDLLVVDDTALRKVTTSGKVTTVRPERSLSNDVISLVALSDRRILLAHDSEIDATWGLPCLTRSAV
jgi:hypothetical protein